MKRIFLLCLLLIGLPSCARMIKVEALSDFSTANPPKTWNLKIAETVIINEQHTIKEGAILEGKITNVKGPARGKRDGSFVYVPTALIMDGQTYPIKMKVRGKYSTLTKMTPGYVAKKGAVYAGNKLFNSTFGPAVALVEGAVKNEEGNVAKSAAVSAFNATPLSYVNKGKDLVIHQGQVFTMNFKEQDFDETSESSDEDVAEE